MDSYDFIIVGGGTAGCLLARRLSLSPARPSVLLVEAGSNPEGEYLRAPFHRYLTAALRPDLDYGYVSEKEAMLNSRQITYTRGKGLGGSSNLNFGVYLYGSGEDYDRWAKLVGDDDWRWNSVKESFTRIENYNCEGTTTYSHLADPSKNQHGTAGDLRVGLPPVLEKGVVPQMEALIEAGEKINLDPNSGDPTGISIFPYSYSKEGRSTSATAHLLDPPDNLIIWTNAKVAKILWEGQNVVGIVTDDDRRAAAKHEVILTAGALDTPKLMLLNGIGPRSELEALSIPVQHDLPGVGKNLRDHVLIIMSVEVDGSMNDRYKFETDKQLLLEADAAWEKDRSGAFALHHSVLWGGFLKLKDLQEYPEFQDLPQEEQEFLNRDGVPTYEFLSNALRGSPDDELSDPTNTYVTFLAFLMNAQSTGEVLLRSSKAEDKPIVKLNFLTHPYDKRIMREATRQTWKTIVENPFISKAVKGVLLGPKSMSDEDIDEFVKTGASTVWHANGTVKMGKPDDANACVDCNGKVYGIQGLRVADLSVCPVTTNNHTQATAYLVGQKMAEKLIKEYGLDR